MERRLYTIADMAERLGIPESSARFYRNRYREFIPAVGEGRGRRYPPEALEVLRLAAALSRSGTPQSVIEQELGSRYERIIEAQTTAATAPEQHQTIAIDALADVVRAAVAAEVAPLREELAAARNELAQLRAALLLSERRALSPPPPAKTQEPQPQPQRAGVVARLLRKLRP